MRLWLGIFLLLFACGESGAFAAASIRYEDQVVRLHVSKREVDPSSPWQSEDTVQQEFLGVVLPNGEILTTANSVANAIFIEMQRFGSTERGEASLVFVDYEVNLALVKPVATAQLLATKAVTLGEDVAMDESVEIFKGRDAYQLSRLPASLQEVAVTSAATSAYGLISYALKVQQSGLGWSEPVFLRGKLVGLTTGQDQNFVQAAPMLLIRHFLSDHHDQSYRGFPAMGVQLEPLLSPDTRRLIGAASASGGVRVAEVFANSPFLGKLQANDVVLAVDGVAVSEQGFVTHPTWGKIHLKYLLNRHFGGDELVLKGLRQGREFTVQAPLQRYDSNRTPVVTYSYGEPQPHLIFGGLVFQELSQDYLKQWGKDWRDIAPSDLLFTLNFANKVTAQPNTRSIFLARVLADPFNRGYTELRHKLVARVNGRPIAALGDLRAALAKPVRMNGKDYARIQFAPAGDEVILGMDGLAQAQARMARTYEIKTASSFYAAP